MLPFRISLILALLLLAILSAYAATPELVIKDYSTNHGNDRYIYESFIYEMEDFTHPRADGLVFHNRDKGPPEQNPHFMGSFAIFNPSANPISCDAVIYFQQVTREGMILVGTETIELWRQHITLLANKERALTYDFELDNKSPASRAIANHLMTGHGDYQAYYKIMIRLESPDKSAPLALLVCENQAFLFTQHVSSPPPQW